MNETELYWKTLHKKSLASKKESVVPDWRVSKDHIMAVVCVNFTSTDKIPVALIEKAQNPLCDSNSLLLLVNT